MLTRSRWQAVESFLTPSRQALGCITKALLLEGRSGPRPTSALLNNGRPIRLRGQSDLYLFVSLLFLVEEIVSDGRRGWQSQSQGYVYLISSAQDKEIIAYHWHPTGLSQMTDPHLHIGASVDSVRLDKAHLPTSLVALPRFIQFLILDLGVEPIRADWQEVLRTAIESQH